MLSICHSYTIYAPQQVHYHYTYSYIIPDKNRPQAVAQRDGGPGRVQAVRNQRARMRANGEFREIF